MGGIRPQGIDDAAYQAWRQRKGLAPVTPGEGADDDLAFEEWRRRRLERSAVSHPAPTPLSAAPPPESAPAPRPRPTGRWSGQGLEAHLAATEQAQTEHRVAGVKRRQAALAEGQAAGTPTGEAKEYRGLGHEVGRSLKRTAGGGLTFAGELADLAGLEGLGAAALRKGAEIEAANPADVGSFKEARATGNYARYLAGISGNAAYMLPIMGAQLGAAGIAARAGAATAAASRIGKAAGMATSMGMGVGEVRSEMDELGNTQEGRDALALLGGVAIGALDYILPGKVADRVAKGTAPGTAVSHSIAQAIRRGAKTTLKEAGTEGVTEGAQELVGYTASRVGSDQPITLELAWQRASEGAVAGAIIGGGVSATSQAYEEGVPRLRQAGRNAVVGLSRYRERMRQAREKAAQDAATGVPTPQAVPGQPQAPPQPVQRPEAVQPSPVGQQTVTFSTGRKVPATYRVVEADQLQSSHDPFSFQRNANYPEGVQGRSYEADPQAQEGVKARAQQLDPDLVLDLAGTPDKGPPLVTPTGLVIAGNERSMLLRRAAELAPERYEAYRQQLAARAAQFGVDPAEVAGMKRPVLVREIQGGPELLDPTYLRELNRASDITDTKAMRWQDQAGSWSRKMAETGTALAHFANTVGPDETITEYLDRGDGKTFVDQLLADGVIPQQEMSKLRDAKTGRLTEEGKLAMKRMMLSAATEDVTAIDRAPAGILAKLETAIPSIVAARTVASYDLRPTLDAALTLLGSAQAQNIKLDDLVDQESMFGEKPPVAVIQLARWLAGAKKGEVTEGFRRYATMARESTGMKDDMFGGMAPSQEEAFLRMVGQEKATPTAAKPERQEPAAPMAGQFPTRFNPGSRYADETEIPEGTTEAEAAAATFRMTVGEMWAMAMSAKDAVDMFNDMTEAQQNSKKGKKLQATIESERQAVEGYRAELEQAFGKEWADEAMRLADLDELPFDPEEQQETDEDEDGELTPEEIEQQDKEWGEWKQEQARIDRVLGRPPAKEIRAAPTYEEDQEITTVEEGMDYLVAWVVEGYPAQEIRPKLAALKENGATDAELVELLKTAGVENVGYGPSFAVDGPGKGKAVQDRTKADMEGFESGGGTRQWHEYYLMAQKALRKWQSHLPKAEREKRLPIFRIKRVTKRPSRTPGYDYLPDSVEGSTVTVLEVKTFEELVPLVRRIYGIGEAPSVRDAIAEAPRRKAQPDLFARTKADQGEMFGGEEVGQAENDELRRVDTFNLAKELLDTLAYIGLDRAAAASHQSPTAAAQVERHLVAARATLAELRRRGLDDRQIMSAAVNRAAQVGYDQRQIERTLRQVLEAMPKGQVQLPGAITQEEIRQRLRQGETFQAEEYETETRSEEGQGTLLSPAVDGAGYTAGSPVSPVNRDDNFAANMRKLLGLKAGDLKRARTEREIARALMKGMFAALRGGPPAVFEGGKRVGKAAMGHFGLWDERIRMHRINHIGTLAHEFGHFISKTYFGWPTRKEKTRGKFARVGRPVIDLTKDSVKELETAGHNLYGSRKPTLGYGEEGIAEAFKFFVTDPARLQREMPSFYLQLKEMFAQNPAFAAPWIQAQKDYAAFLASPLAERLQAKLTMDPRKRNIWSSDDLMRLVAEEDWEFRKAVRELVEMLPGPLQAIANPYLLSRLFKGVGARADNIIHRGYVEVTLNSDGTTNVKRITRSLKEAIDAIPTGEMDAFVRYLTGMSALDRYAFALSRGISNAKPGDVTHEHVLKLSDPERASLELNYKNMAGGSGYGDVGVTIAEAEDATQKYHDRYGPIADIIWENEVQAIVERVQAGLLTARQGKRILAYHPHHVPFARDLSDDPGRAAVNRTSLLPKGVARQTGGGSNIINPLEGVLRNVYETQRDIARHRTMEALAKLALESEGGSRVFTEVPNPKEHIRLRLSQLSPRQLLDAFEELGLELPTNEDGEALTGKELREWLAEHSDIVFDVFLNIQSPRHGEQDEMVFPVQVGEQRRWVQMNPAKRQLYEDLMGLTIGQKEIWTRIMKGASKVSRGVQVGATSTVQFGIRNILRDLQTAMLYTRVRAGVPMGNGKVLSLPGQALAVATTRMIRGMGHLLGRDSIYDLYQLSGGDLSTLLQQDMQGGYTERLRELYAERGTAPMVRYFLRHPIEFLRLIGSASEQANRIGEFEAVMKQALKQGVALPDAMVKAGFAAREVTQDFSKMGALTRAVNMVIPFAAARTGGLVKFGEEIGRLKPEMAASYLNENAGEWDRAQEFLASALISLTLPSLLIYLLQKDDEDYQKVPRWVKNVSWPIMVGGGYYIPIPKPPLIGTLFGTIPELLAERALEGGKNKPLEQMLVVAAQEGIPWRLWDFAPTKPLVENWANRSIFFQTNIESPAVAGQASEYRYGPKTSEAMIALAQSPVGSAIRALPGGETFAGSPAKMENIVRGYGAGVAGYGLEAANMAVRGYRNLTGQRPIHGRAAKPDAPLTDRLMFTKGLVGKVGAETSPDLTNFYDRYKEAEQKFNRWNQLRQSSPAEAAKALSANRRLISLVSTEAAGGTGPWRQARTKINKYQRELRDLAQQDTESAIRRREQVAKAMQDEAARALRLLEPR